MKDLILPIIIAIISSQALTVFVQHLLNRPKKRDLAAAVARLEMEVARLQLIVMIGLDAKNYDAIFSCAKHYFVDLKGDSYVDDIFCKWI